MILFAVVVALAVGPPRTAPPHVSGATVAPPAAWVDDGTRSWWLEYGSYCWRTQCVDFLPPAQRSLPRVRVASGARLTVHLRFRASSVVVRVGTKVVVRGSGLTISWRPTMWGIVNVDTHGPGGSASYLARLGRS